MTTSYISVDKQLLRNDKRVTNVLFIVEYWVFCNVITFLIYTNVDQYPSAIKVSRNESQGC